jgi:hypothetical protein
MEADCMIDRQEARSDVARIDPAADRWLHTANRARATTDPFEIDTTLSQEWSGNRISEDRNVRSKCRCSCVMQFTS